MPGSHVSYSFFFFFFNDTATTEIYTLSLHDALPISCGPALWARGETGPCSAPARGGLWKRRKGLTRDRKSTRLNSSHGYISYAVFCLKKKKEQQKSSKKVQTTNHQTAPPTRRVRKGT